MQKEFSRTKKLRSLDFPTQIKIRHFFFTRKDDKSSTAVNISDLLVQQRGRNNKGYMNVCKHLMTFVLKLLCNLEISLNLWEKKFRIVW